MARAGSLRASRGQRPSSPRCSSRMSAHRVSIQATTSLVVVIHRSYAPASALNQPLVRVRYEIGKAVGDRTASV
jgi:hypothetical protein